MKASDAVAVMAVLIMGAPFGGVEYTALPVGESPTPRRRAAKFLGNPGPCPRHEDCCEFFEAAVLSAGREG